MNPRLVLTCLVTAAALFGYWLLSDGTDEPPTPNPQATETRQPDRPAAAPAAEPAAEPAAAPATGPTTTSSRELIPAAERPQPPAKPSLPVFVAGIVVDEQGNPVPGAKLQFQKESADVLGRPKITSMRIPGATPTSGSDGRFEVRHPVIGLHRFQVRATSEWCVSGLGARFQAGAKDVKLIMKAGGQVHAHVLLPEGSKDREVRARLRERQDPLQIGMGSEKRAYVRQPDGSLRFTKVPPGRYQLLLPDTTIDDIHVRAGEVAMDPRLNPVDLRNVLEVVNLTVVDTQGRTLPDTEVILRNGSQARGRSTDAWGRYTAVVAKEARSRAYLVLSRDEFCTQTITDIQPDMRAVLEPAPSVRVHVPFAVTDLLAGHNLTVSLYRFEQTAGDRNRLESNAAKVTDGQDSLLFLPGAGTFIFRWTLSVRNAGGQLRTRQIECKPTQIVEVRPDTREKTVVAKLTPADIDRTLRKYGVKR